VNRVGEQFWTECHDFLKELSNAQQARLLEGSTRILYPPGTVRYVPDQPDLADILRSGLVRIFATSREGRQATIRYVHPRELLGPLSILLPTRNKVYVQAVTETEVTGLDIGLFWRLAEGDAGIAMSLAKDLAARYSHAIRTIAVRSFGGVRERLAFDLLERACDSQLESGQLIANAGQQQLADAIGSVREVVARTLRELRAEGIVATKPGYVRVLDVVRLEAIQANAQPY
jgi:CRP/FNR family transcriptional regulator